MKTLVILSFLLIGASALAAEWYEPQFQSFLPEDYQCLSQGQLFKNSNNVELACYHWAFSRSKQAQRALGASGDFFAVGYGNLIFTLKRSSDGQIERRVISGPKSQLSEIKAIAISGDEKELAVIDQGVRKEVKLFQAHRHGNVTPLRRMWANFIDQAEKLKFGPSSKEIYLLNSADGALYVLDHEADSRSSKPEQKVATTKELKGLISELKSPVDFLFVDDEVVVLDSASMQLLVFEEEQLGKRAPASRHKLNGGERLQWDSDNQQVLVYDDQNLISDRILLQRDEPADL